MSPPSNALREGSPAIDTGNPSGCTDDSSTLSTDQRGTGYDRTVDGNSDGTAVCDIGAYEYVAAAASEEKADSEGGDAGIDDAETTESADKETDADKGTEADDGDGTVEGDETSGGDTTGDYTTVPDSGDEATSGETAGGDATSDTGGGADVV